MINVTAFTYLLIFLFRCLLEANFLSLFFPIHIFHIYLLIGTTVPVSSGGDYFWLHPLFREFACLPTKHLAVGSRARRLNQRRVTPCPPSPPTCFLSSIYVGARQAQHNATQHSRAERSGAAPLPGRTPEFSTACLHSWPKYLSDCRKLSSVCLHIPLSVLYLLSYLFFYFFLHVFSSFLPCNHVPRVFVCAFLSLVLFFSSFLLLLLLVSVLCFVRRRLHLSVRLCAAAHPDWHLAAWQKAE